MAPAVTIESIGAGGVIQDNESAADHTISGTGEVGRLVELAFPTDDVPDREPHRHDDGAGGRQFLHAQQRRHDRDRPGRRTVGGRDPGRCRGECVLHRVGRV